MQMQMQMQMQDNRRSFDCVAHKVREQLRSG
jgi:hypothetical protein